MTRVDEIYKQLIIKFLTSPDGTTVDEVTSKGREEIIAFLNTREEATFSVMGKEPLTEPRKLKLANVPNGMTQIN